MAAYSGFIAWAICIIWQNGAAATVAQHVRPFLQAMADADPVVENKAVTLPAALILRDLFKVLENAALQVKHIFDTLTD